MKKVILVDDEVFARKGLRVLIPWQDLGYTIVAEASDGEEALKLIEDIQPDLVVTDIRMPVIDGLKLINLVKEERLSQAKFIVITGYNDFAYAQQSLRYGVEDIILKPIDEDEMIETLKRLSVKLEQSSKQKEAIRERNAVDLLDQLLQGNLDQKRNEELVLELGLCKGGHEYRYLLVERNNAPEEEQQQAIANLEKLKLAALTFLSSPPDMIIHDRGSYAFGMFLHSGLLGPYSHSWERLADRLIRELAVCADEAQLQLYAGIPFRKPEQLKASYESTREATLRKLALGDQKIIFAEEAMLLTLQYKDADAQLADILIDKLEENDLAAVKQTVDAAFHSFQYDRLAGQSVNAFLSKCVLSIAGIISRMDGQESHLRSMKPILDWTLRPMTAAGVKGLFLDFIEESAEYLSELRCEKASGGIHKIKLYIDANYRENMSLKSIAKRFFMNPVYLGQLFKKTYQVYFNDYVLGLRVQEAKRLLRQTDCKVYEIAAKVGFSNADYFVTQFEKVEGKTPTEYKQALIARSKT